jgi:flagellar hook-associated protein 2
MGTVGLNFGSPTSGTGFDVSATVSTIMANLQKVETPWKTQLTSLESQDTVLSSLGTLLSSLSNDVSQLTDFTGVLAQKTGSSSDNNVLQLTSASTGATAGTHTVVVKNLAQTSSGYLTALTNSADTLSGSITIQIGGGKSHTITLGTSNGTLSGLASAINSAGVGVTASVLTDSNGSRLSLVSGTSGTNGSLTITSAIVDSSSANAALNYTQSMPGLDAHLNVDGVDLTSAANTVSNLIPGLTFQLLAPSATGSDGTQAPVQVIIGNNNSGVETAINQMVTDYNALIKAVNAQQGKDSSGNPEPLFGSPTLSLLQQQLMSGINVQNPNGYFDAISVNSSTTFSGSITLQVGNGTTQTVVIGAAPDPPAANTFYTGAGINSLQGVADTINAAKIGITAGITTQYGQSRLSLLSQTAGSAGAVNVNSSLTATSDTLLGFTGLSASGDSNSSGVLDSVPSGGDALSGSFTIQVGSGAAQTVPIDPAHNTLQDLADAINGTSGIGVTASVVTNSDGSAYLSIQSQTAGSAGNLTVTSRVLDTTNPTSTDLTYTNSSDISTLANLGITTSQTYDGSLTFDISVLDTALNNDFSGVQGFFQNVNSWGQSFAKMLNNAGTSSSTGMLSVSQKANSSMESTLNAEVSREESIISIQQKSLTAELNSANEIMQGLPSQLDGMNMLYSAITGYNQTHG